MSTHNFFFFFFFFLWIFFFFFFFFFSNALLITQYIEDLTRVAISYGIYETGVRWVSHYANTLIQIY